MLVHNDVGQGGVSSQAQQQNGQIRSSLGWKELKPASRKTRGQGRRRILVIASLLLLFLVILATVRVASVASGTNDQLTLTIGSQQAALLDLRQSAPISPYLFGTNVFPEAQSSSVDLNYSGFMSYGPEVENGLKNADINLLRFPGGSWGEQHILSYDQLYDFSNLLYTTGAEGMVQARLSLPIDKYSKTATLEERANFAGNWVDFMSNPKSRLRQGKYANVQIHPIKFWSVGNEPDRLVNPDTGKPYTVAEYVQAFIAYSKAMHQNNPSIKVFGPELSQFYGVGVGPRDATGQLWMEGFLQGVAAYEKVNKLPYHLLDGISFHYYPFLNAQTSPYLMLSSTNEWNYLLPQLRQFIRQTFEPVYGSNGADLPVAITEINTTPSVGQQPTRGQAALWWADTLGQLMNQQVDYVSFFSTEGVNAPYPLFTDSQSPQQTAMFRVFQVFSHLQRNLLPLQVQHDPVSAYATVDDSRQTVSLLFVNKSGGNQAAQVAPRTTAFGFSPWHTLDISIGAYSVVAVTLHRDSGAEAYSFIVPSTIDTAINPLLSTVCGNKTDPLAYNIPC